MKNLHYLVSLISPPHQEKCFKIVNDNIELFKKAPGSKHNHQTWVGGYIDHVLAIMNLACSLYHSMSKINTLPFTLSDALLILFLHDLEKPWGPEKNFKSREEKALFRLAKLQEYGIELNEYQHNALKYAEGENNDYSPERRVMNELAAFVHMCDLASSRIWYDWKIDQGFGY